MDKFDIKNKYTGDVQFTATIDCSETATISEKIRLALLQGLKLKANLHKANLHGVNLHSAGMKGADLQEADLDYANLEYANLSHSTLKYVDLTRANLSNANMQYADLSHANLDGANLSCTDLSHANLDNANLNNVIGNSINIITVQCGLWIANYTSTHLSICDETHTIIDWFNFSDHEINRMDDNALEFWKKWKPILKSIIEVNPARPTTNG